MILHRVGISIQGRNLEKKLLNLRLFLLLRLFFDFDKMESSSSQLDIYFFNYLMRKHVAPNIPSGI